MNVCLVMIVKNESHVIERCLRSVMPFITHWVICDTGSEDGTQGKIQEILKDIPGELYEDEWQDFAHNRTLAIQRAKGKGDWLLMMDADHEWHSKFPDHLTGDGYLVEHRYSWLTYGIPILMRGDREWSYRYPVHETIEGRDTRPFAMLPAPPYVKVYPEGARSRDPLKYAKDAVVMQRFVDANTDDARGVLLPRAVVLECRARWRMRGGGTAGARRWRTAGGRNAGTLPTASPRLGRRLLTLPRGKESGHRVRRGHGRVPVGLPDEPCPGRAIGDAGPFRPHGQEPDVRHRHPMAARQASIRTIPRPPVHRTVRGGTGLTSGLPDDEFSISAAYIGQTKDEGGEGGAATCCGSPEVCRRVTGRGSKRTST